MIRFWYLLAGLIPGLWLLWVFQLPLARQFGMIWRPEVLGLWGDSFGALNSLFAGVAAIGVAATLYLQRKSMAEEKRDQSRQRFEGHFFQLLELSRDLRNEIRGDHPKVEPGPAAVSRYASYLKSAVANGQIDVASKNSAASVYLKLVHNRGEAGLGAYFRVLFNIFRLIDSERSLTDKDRELYGNIVRAQLSSNELILIGFNALIPQSGVFGDYVKRYRVLRYVPEGQIRSIFLLHHKDEALSPRGDTEEGEPEDPFLE